jgi:hypothetical protein
VSQPPGPTSDIARSVSDSRGSADTRRGPTAASR